MAFEENKLSKRAARAFELEPGKGVLVEINPHQAIRADYRCLDKDSDICDNECRLRFRCYIGQYLILKPEDLDLSDIGMTLNEKVEAFIMSNRPQPEPEIEELEEVEPPDFEQIIRDLDARTDISDEEKEYAKEMLGGLKQYADMGKVYKAKIK